MDPMDERLSVAPMMEWTDPHWRRLARIITKRTVLYTEMVVDDTIIHSPNLDFYFGRGIEEEPSVIQVGGHDPENLGKACEIVQKYGGGYGEVNLVSTSRVLCASQVFLKCFPCTYRLLICTYRVLVCRTSDI
jgi:tRNA-dihydrouridine synthase A